MPNATSFGTLRLLALICGLFSLLAVSISADAAGPPQRTFVHSDPIGNDANDCSLAFPCRTFDRAITVVAAGGEVVILDTAGYGPFTIGKSVKVIGPSGVYGGISVKGAGIGSTTGIVINAGPGDDITLRGLDVSGVPTVAPFPDIGIDIQSAGAVHIEKSSIGNFNQATSSCINFSTPNTVRVYVVDSFLRECRTGISAHGTSAVLANKASLIVDNTRIERGRGPVVSYGVWVQGAIDVSLRNSMISRQDSGVQVENLLAAVTHVEILNSELTRNTTAIQVISTTPGGIAELSLNRSQILGSTDAIKVSNNATPVGVTLSVTDSEIGYTGAGGIQMANTGGDANARLFMEFVRSSVHNISANAVDLSATNGSKTYFDARDSSFSHTANDLIKTSGTSRVAVSLIRSDLRFCGTAINHGNGEIRLDGSHVVQCNQDFVNNGSPTIFSLKNNFVFDNTDAPGPTYITPTPIGPI